MIIYLDNNDNGFIDSNDEIIGEVNSEELKSTIPIKYTLETLSAKNLLFVYEMKEKNDLGSFSLSLVSLEGKGEISEKLIQFSGPQISSSEIKIIKGKSCIGTITMSFTPQSVNKGDIVSIVVGNLSGCDSNQVFIQSTPCYNPSGLTIGKCTLKEGACSLNAIATVEKNYACIDKNNDGDKIDFGESVASQIKFLIPIISENNTNNENTKSEIPIESPTTKITNSQNSLNLFQLY